MYIYGCAFLERGWCPLDKILRLPKDVRKSTPAQQLTIPRSSLLQCSPDRVPHHRLRTIGEVTRNY